MTEQDEERKETAPPISESAPIVPATEEKIGYGRPPRHTQFKPGQSGNPKGRPKGARSLSSMMMDELRAPVEFMERGRRLRLPKFQVAIRQLVKQAVEGNPKATSLILQVCSKPNELNKPQKEAPNVATEQSVTALKEVAELFRAADKTSDTENTETP